jgi:hypothetical protein
MKTCRADAKHRVDLAQNPTGVESECVGVRRASGANYASAAPL